MAAILGQMCGRMNMTLVNWSEVLRELTEILADEGVDGLGADDEALSLYRPRYNVAPAQEHMVLRRFEGRARLSLGRWGLPGLAEPDPRLLRAAQDDLLVATPVSLRVNSIRHNDPACLSPPRNVQLSLF